MTGAPHLLCIGSVLWDVIGRSPRSMRKGSDVPGRITRIPGGVALNIAIAFRDLGLAPELLTCVGRDKQGDELIAAVEAMGIGCGHIYRSPNLPTDVYMAIEGAGELIAAVADAHSLEEAGAAILTPLADGTLGSQAAPFAGTIALDGNLTTGLLANIATSPTFDAADLRVAPASPGKADRLSPFLKSGRGTLYVNLEEAQTLCGGTFSSASEAATALVEHGAARALVTNGEAEAADADTSGEIKASPPSVDVVRVTGAGDTFMAAHIAIENTGKSRQEALISALGAAARYVSGDKPA